MLSSQHIGTGPYQKQLNSGSKCGFAASKKIADVEISGMVIFMEYEEFETVEVPIDGTLDLHTFRPGEISSLIPEYLHQCLRLGITEVRIIHGKGRGVLRRSVHSILGRLNDVESFKLAPSDRGHWGATLVKLRTRQGNARS